MVYVCVWQACMDVGSVNRRTGSIVDRVCGSVGFAWHTKLHTRTYVHTRVPMGIKNGPPRFQRFMTELYDTIGWTGTIPHISTHIDDTVVGTCEPKEGAERDLLEQHYHDLRTILLHLRANEVYLGEGFRL